MHVQLYIVKTEECYLDTLVHEIYAAQFINHITGIYDRLSNPISTNEYGFAMELQHLWFTSPTTINKANSRATITRKNSNTCIYIFFKTHLAIEMLSLFTQDGLYQCKNISFCRHVIL